VLARETDRVAIGSYTFVGTLSHPMRSAEQLSVIDNLSRGRLFTTVSRGFLPEFWGQFGIPQERMLGRFLEGLRIWRRAFSGERFSFEGDHWQVRQGQLAPPPISRAAGRCGAGEMRRRRRDARRITGSAGPATRCR
jgi:alkanesulfonate monooxygenase SsuD/methylene tetrahydromethanopterin reductase-like flavin-dependent oxidoreductase (luciferase family)